MRNIISTATFTAIVGAATMSLLAQTQTPPPGANPSTDRRITVTGCLKQAPAGILSAPIVEGGRTIAFALCWRRYAGFETKR